MLFLIDYTKGFKKIYSLFGLNFFNYYHGIFSWHTYFKMSLLRHISFNMDYYWMLKKKHIHQDINTLSEYRKSQEIHHLPHYYNLLEYFAFIYYIPLFIAGPIITFNSFISQVFFKIIIFLNYLRF